MDRVVGYMVSRCCGKDSPWFVGRSRSVCRGPSQIEREREIKAFVPEGSGKLTLIRRRRLARALPLQVTHQNDKPFPAGKIARTRALAAVETLEKRAKRTGA